MRPSRFLSKSKDIIPTVRYITPGGANRPTGDPDVVVQPVITLRSNRGLLTQYLYAMTNEINGTRGKFYMKLRNCNNRFILFVTIFHRI